jgi:hypothetical protein
MRSRAIASRRGSISPTGEEPHSPRLVESAVDKKTAHRPTRSSSRRARPSFVRGGSADRRTATAGWPSQTAAHSGPRLFSVRASPLARQREPRAPPEQNCQHCRESRRGPALELVRPRGRRARAGCVRLALAERRRGLAVRRRQAPAHEPERAEVQVVAASAPMSGRRRQQDEAAPRARVMRSQPAHRKAAATRPRAVSTAARAQTERPIFEIWESEGCCVWCRGRCRPVREFPI